MKLKTIPLARAASRPKPAASKVQLLEAALGEIGCNFALDKVPESQASLKAQIPLPPQDPAQLAATILIEWAMCVQGVSVEELRRPGTVSAVTVPSGDWAEPVYQAWKIYVSGTEATGNATCNSSFGRAGLEAFVCAESPSKLDRERHDERTAEAIWRSQCIVAFAPEVSWMPPDLVEAVEYSLMINRLHVGAVSEVARRLTGSEPSIELTADEALAVGPRLLRLARRPNQSANQYLRKLRQLVRTSAAVSAAEKTEPKTLVPSDCITLERLYGMDEAVDWGKALHEDLGMFAAGRRNWTDVDRGVLLSGPPGCGKTIFAQALARTCAVPLIEGSWSRWLASGSGHQGDFMLAMRKTFEDARRQTPCILFLDEIDSFPNRGTLTHAQRDWDIQCVNALLAELDGVEARCGVVVVGACNNPHLLDPALLRSGRLDRHVRIGLPDRSALSHIIREHLGTDLVGVDLSDAALLACGSTGADVERVVRGARRRARNADRSMALADLMEEIGGADHRTPDELMRFAVHEAGHSVAAVEVGLTVGAATIRATEGKGGAITTLNQRFLLTDFDINDEMMYLLSGRAAEHVVLGMPSNASGGDEDSDLALATWLAARATSEFGLDEERGLVWAPLPERKSDLRGALTRDPALADLVQRRLASAYSDACTLVQRRKSAVEAVASALLAHIALDGEEIARIVETHGQGKRQ